MEYIIIALVIVLVVAVATYTRVLRVRITTTKDQLDTMHMVCGVALSRAVNAEYERDQLLTMVDTHTTAILMGMGH